MGERIVYVTRQDIEGRDKPVMEGTIIDVEKGKEWPLTAQESGRIIDAVTGIQRPLTRLSEKAEAIQGLKQIIDEVAEEASHDTAGIRELKQAGVKFHTEERTITGKPRYRNLI